MVKNAYYCKKQETEINRLIDPAVKTAKSQLAAEEKLRGPLDKNVRADLFSRFFHLEMDRRAKEKGLRV